MRTRAPGTVTSPEFARGPAAHHSPGVHAALSVLEALIVAESLSLSELAARLGIPKSSLLRVCSVLTHRGWVTRARDGRYSLGVRADRARQVVAAEYAGRSLVTPTGRRLRGVEELLEILEGVRRNGWAENNDETALGLYTIAVPIRNAASGVLAALTMCVPTARMSAARREQILSDLTDAGRRLSDGVSWLPAWNAIRSKPSRVRAARS